MDGTYTYLRCSPLPLVGRCKQQDARDVDETGRDAGAGMMGYGMGWDRGGLVEGGSGTIVAGYVL